MNAYKFNKEYEKKLSKYTQMCEGLMKVMFITKQLFFRVQVILIQNRREERIFDRVWISDLNKSLVNIEAILFSLTTHTCK